jgi:hypothetical protein
MAPRGIIVCHMSAEPDATEPDATSGCIRAVMQRWPLLSLALGLVLVFFFVDGLLRNAGPVRGSVLLVVGVFLVIGLATVSDGAVPRGIHLPTVATVLGGALLVGWGGRSVGLSAVFSAAVLGTLAALLPRLVKQISDADVLPVYVGAMAGMTSPVVLLGPAWLILAGLLTGCLWCIVREAWIGVGGKIGTIAFAGVALTALVSVFFGYAGATPPLPQYARLQEVGVLAVAIVGALVTHWLAYGRRWGVLLASAAPTAVVVAVSVGISRGIALPNDALAAAWFGASFVGMTAPARLGERRWTLVAAAGIFGVLLLLFEAHLAGLGGDLGATAAASVISVLGLRWTIHRLRRTRPASAAE